MAAMCVVCGEKKAKVYDYYCSMACAGADYVWNGEHFPVYPFFGVGLPDFFYISVPPEVISGLDFSGLPAFLV